MLKFSHSSARVSSPSGKPVDWSSVTHLAIGAHPDDLEFMAGHGIVQCMSQVMDKNSKRGFAGVTVASGAEDQVLKEVRRKEQEEAARLGDYKAIVTLDHLSRELKLGNRTALVEDLKEILSQVRLEVLYTHNPMDKHDTHVAVCVSVIEALRALPADRHPKLVYGCEVWRGLDWLIDQQKSILDVSAGEDLLRDLMKVYKSQLADKAYDEAVMGRKRSNATFLDARAKDQMKYCEYALDMTPLIRDPNLSVMGWVGSHLQAFGDDVNQRLKRFLG